MLVTWRNALDATNAAYDRSLFGAVKSIDANISTESGGLGVELPYRMLEFFQLTASGQVYYRVATEDGLVEIGNADLPPGRARPLVSGRPQFTTPTTTASRCAWPPTHELSRPGRAGQPQRVVIQVAETLDSRQRLPAPAGAAGAVRDLLLVLAASGPAGAGRGWALRPLARCAARSRRGRRRT
jgi:two-component system sensor histidine kinase TctE